jgi:uroporphyrinogen-III synthase
MAHETRIGVVLTRPVGRARSLAAPLAARGFKVVALPGSSISAPEDASTALRGLATARRADAVIFLSPAAVTSAFRIHPSLNFARHVRVFAPGPGTKAALARHGVIASCPVARYDSEGLLALPALHDIQGRSIVLIGAPGGRERLPVALRRRGALVEWVHVYSRRAARLDRRHFSRLAALPRALISVWSSLDAIRHLIHSLPPGEVRRLQQAPAVASSERIAEALHAHGFEQTALAGSARPVDLTAAVEVLALRHRKAMAAPEAR